MRYPLTLIKPSDLCAEIGVWKGEFSQEILTQKPKELHLVDPWIHQTHKWVQWAKGEAVKQAYKEVLGKFSNINNVHIHKENSCAINIGENYFDWVYIDADHSYESVKKDLQHWFRQVKNGGFLCGDDYGWSHPLTKGPKPAVDEFVKENDLNLETHGSQYVIKIEK